MTDRLLRHLLLCLGLALAGCAPPISEWSDAEASKPIRVDYVRLQHDAAFMPGSADLAEGEADALAAFLDQAEVAPDDHVFFQPASDDKLVGARIGQLTHQLVQRSVSATTLPPTATGVATDHMTVVVERYVVTPPDCPNWSKSPAGDHSNTLPSNFGCADATNLGLMVADPRDLVVGRSPGPPRGDPALNGYARFRNGKPAKPDTTITSGSFSSSGAAAGATPADTGY
jgi:pilus assembly protein CpaD